MLRTVAFQPKRKVNIVFDKVTGGVKLHGMATTDITNQVREMKARGMTWDEIAKELGTTKQAAHYHGRPRPGENLCRSCCRPLKRIKNLSNPAGV